MRRANRGGQQGINSLEIGLRIARVISECAAPLALKDLAAAAGIAPAKAHRYLVSLIRAGLAEQDRETGRYRLGPLALEMGLAALRGIDVLKFGAEVIAELRAAIDETVLLAIWGNKGPVVARWEESSRPVATNVRAGWVMPLLNSATGRCFAAYLPEAITAPILESELALRSGERAGFAARLDEIRTHGLSRVEGDLLSGVASVAAPVFGQEGRIVAVIAALGPQGAFDVGWQAPIAIAVGRAAHALSARLGGARTPGRGVPEKPQMRGLSGPELREPRRRRTVVVRGIRSRKGGVT
jgi:DNA-binding IclR family transcriptional regulator